MKSLFLLVGFAVLMPQSCFGDGPQTTTLEAMLEMVKADAKASMEIRELERDWIGELTNEEGEVQHLRLEKGMIREGEITLLRIMPNRVFVGSDAPVRIASAPSIEQLKACDTVAKLKELLGRGMPGFDGWGGPEGMHSSHSWVCFSPLPNQRLAYLKVFAHTSFNEEQRKLGITQVNEIKVISGVLRPENPGDPNEMATYLTGEALFQKEEAEKFKELERFPQPLRDLLTVDEHPMDPDLKHLSAAVQKIRDHPDPKLMAQLVGHMHEDAVRFQMLLGYILFNEHGILKLKPWEGKKEEIAVKACIDSLPQADEDSVEELIAILLQVSGGGTIQVSHHDDSRRIEVTLRKDGGVTKRYGGASDPIPLQDVQVELLRLYRQSREKQR